MKKYLLDKVLNVDTTYEAESDKAYVIRAVGTDSSSKATLSVGGVNCLEIINELARMNPTTHRLYDLFGLGDYFVVVPPDKKFSFSGSSGSKMRIVGEIIELDATESLPPDLDMRYDVQGKKYMSYLRGTYSHGTDTAWTAGDENAVLTKTAEAGTRYYLTGNVYVDIANLASVHSPGDWTLRFYLQDAPYDILSTNMGDLGVDVWRGFWNDGTNYYYKPFKYEHLPPQIDPGRTFKVTCINSSGASKSPSSGTSITVTVTLSCVVELL